MYKNVAGQKIVVYVHNNLTNEPETGDAANITAYVARDAASVAQSNDVNPTELDATNMKGLYAFDLTQVESDADVVALSAVSTTSDVDIEPVVVHTQVSVDDVWDEVLTDATHNVPSSAGRRLRALEDVTVIREETAASDGGGTNTIELDAGASAVDDFYEEDWVMLTSGTGNRQMRHVDAYDGATKVATLGDDWDPAINGTENFVILARSSTHPHSIEALALSQIADAVHDEVIEGTLTHRQAQRLLLAVLTGKSSGGGSTTITFRDVGDTKDRIVVTVDKSGNRTAVDTRDGG